MADIFVSFTRADQQWAHWIAQELTALHHEPHVHDWEIGPGEDIVGWMEKRHDQADYVLCVVSPDYLNEDKAPFSTWERRAALWRMAKGQKGHVLLFVVKPVKLPSLIDHLRRCDLAGFKEEEARRRIAGFLRSPAPPEKIVFPGEDGVAVSNVPIAIPEHFVGRTDGLEAIDAALKRHEGRMVVAAVHGLRGVGKSTLAAAYAERHRGQYRATWWVRAQTPDSMRADLVALGVRLAWVEADEKEAQAFEKVMERLRHEGEGLLILYDNAANADALKPFLPKGGAARALVTSNAPDWRGLGEPIELKIWPKQTGADYLIARTGRANERAEAEALSEALGGLPLAHEQAAAYSERLSVAFADYAGRFAAAPIKLLDANKDAPLEYHNKRTVAKTFALAIDEAAKLHPAAEPLILHAALLACEPIPLFLFSEAREKFGEPLASQLTDDGLDEAVAALRAFALVGRERIQDERDPAILTETIRLHRLVRTVTAGRLQGEAVEGVRRALIQAMAKVYPATVFDDPGAWPRARRLDTLALDLVGGPSDPPSGVEDLTAHLLDRLGRYRQRPLAAYAQARRLLERALAIAEKKFGSNHDATTTILTDLGFLLRNEGDLAAAKPLFKRALAIRETILAADHPFLAISLDNLGQLYQAERKHVRAKALFERSLAIREKIDPGDPQTATTLNNLARSLEARGDLTGAQRLFERALRIFENKRGREHPDTATTLGYLANTCLLRRDFAGGRTLFERALTIYEKSLGPDHPNASITRNNLASVRLAQGAPSDALALSDAALTALLSSVGPKHTSVRSAAAIKAAALYALGRADDAAALRSLYGIGAVT